MRGFRFRSTPNSERCAHICLVSSQNSNVWRPNIHVWTHFEPIFSLRVHGWIQTTVSQLAGVRGCRRKRQLSFFIYYRFTPLHNKQILKWNKLTLLQQTKTNKKKTKKQKKQKTKKTKKNKKKTKKSCGEGDNQKHQCAILGMPPLINI